MEYEKPTLEEVGEILEKFCRIWKVIDIIPADPKK